MGTRRSMFRLENAVGVIEYGRNGALQQISERRLRGGYTAADGPSELILSGFMCKPYLAQSVVYNRVI
jgi:hypothetical protein